MAVNRNIGFFHGIVENVNLFARKNDLKIRPPVPISSQKADYNTLKSLASAKDTYGSDNIFHWGSHKWGDLKHFVAQ